MTETLLKRRIVGIHRALKGRPDLRPSADVNRLFKRLVALTLDGPAELAERVLASPEVRAIRPELQELCARGEFELETHWSDRVAEAADPRLELARFPYYRHYELATRMEAACLFSVRRRFVRRVLFAGSGPLPLTSVLLAREHGIQVDNVEVDAEACRRGARLAARLGLSDRLRFFHADVLDYEPDGEHDAVFLAALAGLDEAAKNRLLSRLRGLMPESSLLVIRSAHRLRALVYPAVPVDGLRGFEPVVELRPHNEIMNSNLIVRRSAGAR